MDLTGPRSCQIANHGHPRLITRRRCPLFALLGRGSLGVKVKRSGSSLADAPPGVALDMGMPAENFGRIHHLPAAQLATVVDGMRDRDLTGDDGWLTKQGRAVRRQRVETLTDSLAAKPYESLEPDELDELDELVTSLQPLAKLLLAAQDW